MLSDDFGEKKKFFAKGLEFLHVVFHGLNVDFMLTRDSKEVDFT